MDTPLPAILLCPKCGSRFVDDPTTIARPYEILKVGLVGGDVQFATRAILFYADPAHGIEGWTTLVLPTDLDGLLADTGCSLVSREPWSWNSEPFGHTWSGTVRLVDGKLIASGVYKPFDVRVAMLKFPFPPWDQHECPPSS